MLLGTKKKTLKGSSTIEKNSQKVKGYIIQNGSISRKKPKHNECGLFGWARAPRFYDNGFILFPKVEFRHPLRIRLCKRVRIQMGDALPLNWPLRNTPGVVKL